jgi:hypothetical protein
MSDTNDTALPITDIIIEQPGQPELDTGDIGDIGGEGLE